MRPCPYVRTYVRFRVYVQYVLAHRAQIGPSRMRTAASARGFTARFIAKRASVFGPAENGKRDNFATGLKTMIKYIMKIIALNNRGLCAPPTRIVLQAAENLPTFKRLLLGLYPSPG